MMVLGNESYKLKFYPFSYRLSVDFSQLSVKQRVIFQPTVKIWTILSHQLKPIHTHL